MLVTPFNFLCPATATVGKAGASFTVVSTVMIPSTPRSDNNCEYRDSNTGSCRCTTVRKKYSRCLKYCSIPLMIGELYESPISSAITPWNSDFMKLCSFIEGAVPRASAGRRVDLRSEPQAVLHAH